MKNVSPEICRKIAQARRDQGISQTALALELGCKQPAISMFEAGDGTKLSEEMVKKLAMRFGISLEVQSKEASGSSERKETIDNLGQSTMAFCPNCHCPSNVPYVVEGRLLFRPSCRMASPVKGGRRCAVCGEVLEQRCPACGAPLNAGACCVVCGLPYVTSTLPPGTDVEGWARTRRDEIVALRKLN